MSLDRWVAFVGVLLVVLVTPGPDFAMVLRHAVTSARAGALASAGIVVGLFGHTAAAAAGLSAVVAAHPHVLTVVTLVGAVYLFVLGAQSIRSGLRRTAAASADPATAPPAGGHPFRDGLASNLLNPKALLFFLGLIPQFLVPDRPAVPQILVMAATTVTAAALWWVVVISAVTVVRTAASRRPARPRRHARRAVDVLCGTALVGVSMSLVRG